MTEVKLPITAELRRAGWSDLDQIMDVMTAAFDPQFGEAWTRAQCAGILPMHGVTMTIATAGEAALGFSLSRQVADECELLLLAVSPEARGRGLGAQLLERFRADGARTGVRKLHLEVRDGNPAVHLYRRHEFVVEGRRRQYYRGTNGQLYDALTMIRLI